MNAKTHQLTDQQRKDFALATLAVLTDIYITDGNAILSHNDSSTTAHPEAAFVSIVS